MSLIFDGTNVKYGTFPNESLFNNSTAFSLVVWFKPTGGVTQQHLIGADQNAGGSTRYSGIYYRGNASGVVAFTKSAVEAHYNIGTPTVNQWSVAIVSRPTGATAQTTPMALDATDTSASTLTNGSSDLARFIIGARRIAGGSTYTDLANAKIGGFAIYQRQLTSGEIDQYQTGAHPDDVGGFTDYMMFSGSGTATTQVSENGRTMTFVGSPALDTDTPFPSQEITDINGSDPVSGDTSGNTFTTTGFTEDITDVTVGGLECTAVDETAGDGTFTVPPPVHLEVYPEIGVNQDVVISGATETATLSKSFVLTGWTVTALVDPEIVDLTYPTAHFDVTPVTTDLMITKTADVISVAPDGGVIVADPIYTIIMHWKRSTGVMYIYGFTISAEGVVNRGLTAIGLTSIGLTSSGLTAVGL